MEVLRSNRNGTFSLAMFDYLIIFGFCIYDFHITKLKAISQLVRVLLFRSPAFCFCGLKPGPEVSFLCRVGCP
jgi:hypothetical protein